MHNAVRLLFLLVPISSIATAQTLYTPGGTVGASSNGNVSVGTATSGTKFHVQTAVANDGMSASDGTRWMLFAPGTVGSGSFNPIVSANENALIFTGGSIGTGAFSMVPWSNSAAGMKLLNTGSVGINTGTPGGSYGDMSTVSTPVVDIATRANANSTVLRLLHVPDSPAAKYQTALEFGVTDGVNPAQSFNAARIYAVASASPSYETQRLTFATPTGIGTWSDTMSLVGGRVGIGTVSPTHALAVNGTVRAKEVVVDTGWSDYVFDDDYRLAPLDAVEAHIKAKKHLPGIPSAAEVAEHGISVGEMQSKLLAKIEELTLHLIRLEKENATLRERIGVLEARP